MKLHCLITLTLTCSLCIGQNLVPNGDFESYSGCPDNWSEIDSALFWMNPSTGDPYGSPDYYNQCSTYTGVPLHPGGYQYAHNGVGYSGIYLTQPSGDNGREYIEVPLTVYLSLNSCYHLELYINLYNNSALTTDAIEAYFSDTAIVNINNSYYLPFTPQISNNNGNTFDTLNWTLVSGNYMAQGGEKYLVIGNFKSDSNTATSLVNSSGYMSVYTYIDDVSLVAISSSCDLGIISNIESGIEIYPNPFTETLTFTNNNKELSAISLCDFTERNVLQEKFTNSITLNTGQLANGIYLYEVRNLNGITKTGKIVKQ